MEKINYTKIAKEFDKELKQEKKDNVIYAERVKTEEEKFTALLSEARTAYKEGKIEKLRITKVIVYFGGTDKITMDIAEKITECLKAEAVNE